MVMRVSLNSATVTGPNGEKWEKKQVETRNGQLLVRERHGSVLLDVTATAVRKVANRKYEVDTEQGLYLFERAGCGCGR